NARARAVHRYEKHTLQMASGEMPTERTTTTTPQGSAGRRAARAGPGYPVTNWSRERLPALYSPATREDAEPAGELGPRRTNPRPRIRRPTPPHPWPASLSSPSDTTGRAPGVRLLLG